MSWSTGISFRFLISRFFLLLLILASTLLTAHNSTKMNHVEDTLRIYHGENREIGASSFSILFQAWSFAVRRSQSKLSCVDDTSRIFWRRNVIMMDFPNPPYLVVMRIRGLEENTLKIREIAIYKPSRSSAVSGRLRSSYNSIFHHTIWPVTFLHASKNLKSLCRAWLLWCCLRFEYGSSV